MIVWVPGPSCEGAGTQIRLMSYLKDALPYWPISGPRAVGSIAAQGCDLGLGAGQVNIDL